MTHGDPWVEELMAHVENNRACLRNWLDEHAPQITLFDAEATYFAWLDCRPWGVTDDELMRWLEKDARIILTAGHTLGTGGSGHVRWNLACSLTTLEAGLERLAKALQHSLLRRSQGDASS